MLAGEAALILKVITSDWDSYQSFVTTRLAIAPNVSHVKSALVLRCTKRCPGPRVETN